LDAMVKILGNSFGNCVSILLVITMLILVVPVVVLVLPPLQVMPLLNLIVLITMKLLPYHEV